MIAAPRERTWPLLVDTRTWHTWWPAVTNARSTDLKPLREASRFEATLELGFLKATLRGTVDLYAEAKSLGWSGRIVALPLRHAWYLTSRPAGTNVQQRTSFPMPVAVVLRVMRWDQLWRQMLKANLHQLKRVAERLV